MLVSYTFEVVEVKGIRRWIDSDGKKRQETRKFSQTINPYNRGADGTMKTLTQIMAEITKQRDEWVAQP